MKANLPVTLGTFDVHTVQADFDLTPYKEAKYWAHRANERFNLDGFLILETSKKYYRTKDKQTGKLIYSYSKSNYNVVWDRYVEWKENIGILGWLALESHIQGLDAYLKMQCIKQSSTLRLSEKSWPHKKAPKIVYSYGSQDGQIKQYLEHKQWIAQLIQDIKKEREMTNNQRALNTKS